jgi:hypothetical protein
VRELGPTPDVASAFGEDAFGRRAEAAARFFGTPKYILSQLALVIAWIAVNAVAVGLRWDPLPVHPPQPRVLDPGRPCGTTDPARADAPGRPGQGRKRPT